MRRVFLVLLALCLALVVTPCVSAQGPLIIAHMTDAHIITLGSVNALRTRSVFQLAGGSVLVDTGDCTNDGTALEWGRYQQLAASRRIQSFYVTAGNHDSGAVPYSQGWVLDRQGVRLIGIDSRHMNLVALELALLNGRSQGGDVLPAIIFGHFDFGFYDPGTQAGLRRMFAMYHVLAYVAGHSHLETDVLDTSGTRLITAGPAFKGYWQRIFVLGRTVSVTNVHLY